MNDDLSKLMHDAVAGVGGHAPAEQLVGRLAAVDRRRKLGVMVTAATAMVLASFGVAAAWPENQAPIRIEIGDEGVDDQELDEDAFADIDEEEAPEEPVVEDAAEERPADDVDEASEESTDPEFVLDLDLSNLEIATPTPEPTPAPIPTATPVPQPAPPAAPPQGGGGHDDGGSGDGGKAGEGGQEHQAGEGGQEHQGGEGGQEHQGGEGGQEHEGGEGGQEQGGGEVAFSASAQYGSCEEPIPYDNYSGTAAPGATVTITSPWSATTTATADGSGHWAVQVTFEAAPVDEPFTVTISSGGDSVGLGFVRTG